MLLFIDNIFRFTQAGSEVSNTEYTGCIHVCTCTYMYIILTFTLCVYMCVYGECDVNTYPCFI